mmetsp:Transcript_4314/g.5953  ORF Transcript_4314/g.5953 Transcript_4314/m.5953 type:complete len:100 (-) Transcript_4314:220-519(-)
MEEMEEGGLEVDTSPAHNPQEQQAAVVWPTLELEQPLGVQLDMQQGECMKGLAATAHKHNNNNKPLELLLLPLLETKVAGLPAQSDRSKRALQLPGVGR